MLAKCLLHLDIGIAPQPGKSPQKGKTPSRRQALFSNNDRIARWSQKRNNKVTTGTAGRWKKVNGSHVDSVEPFAAQASFPKSSCPGRIHHQFQEFTNCQTGVIWKITVVSRKHLKKFGVGKVERCSCCLLVGQRTTSAHFCPLQTAKNVVESNL